ncbi:hypothetical protein Agabi119p4_2837 [Agaricus bisporus var. burnettii]|uniref:Uncharacterized protein n=1 Tax=Agaricus bisporus var. burnettii TaxID=192524 RepID=A0A8H7KIL7_AGABI|nr:hypothetical protein Agabi119p4_2837 [Agaricus bisporus var. burnettii]
MLLKFTSTDMFNTSLVDVATGKCAYEITTVPTPCKLERPLPPALFSSSKTTAVSENSLPAKQYPIVREKSEKDITYRRTQIRDASGNLAADVQWEGRHPHITIDGEEVGGLNDLFGTSTVRFLPKILAIPTKYDADYVWTATAESLTLVDYNTDETKGTFHQNVIRLPTLKSKPKLFVQTQLTPPSSPPVSPTSPRSLFRSRSRTSSVNKSTLSLSLTEEQLPCDTPKSTFLPTHVPGFGSNYLEFVTHPLTKDVEVILSFLLMEILRRGRFNLTPYTFENPSIWQFKEARDVVLRTFRRNTI